eukprot:g2119.t1
MEMLFAGTGAMAPIPSRGVACTLLRNDGELWMFDCGEGTQLNLSHSAWGLKALTKIFITHLHGDHILGLPGLLMAIAHSHSASTYRKFVPKRLRAVEIFGPPGISEFLKACEDCMGSKFADHVVYEIQDIPSFSAGKGSTGTEAADKGVDGTNGSGLQIAREEDGFWTLVDNPLPQDPRDVSATACLKRRQELSDDWHAHLQRAEAEYGALNRSDRTAAKNTYMKFRTYNSNGMRVRAGPVSHTIETLGFAVETPLCRPPMAFDRLPALFDCIKRNADAFAADGLTFRDVMSACSSMQPGGRFTFPDGSTFGFNDIFDEDEIVPSLKLAILGDTRDARASLKLFRGANVLVHEATNIVQKTGEGRASAKERRAKSAKVYTRGHSTPEMAGKFAKKAEVGSLVLNHFSRSIKSSDMKHIQAEASKASGLETRDVLCARDNLLLHIHVKRKGPRASGIGSFYDVRDARKYGEDKMPRISWGGNASGVPKKRRESKKLGALRKEVEMKMAESQLRLKSSIEGGGKPTQEKDA